MDTSSTVTVVETVVHVQDVYSVDCIGCHLSSSLLFVLYYLDSGCMSDGYTVAFCCLILKKQCPYLLSSSCLPHPGGMVVADD